MDAAMGLTPEQMSEMASAALLQGCALAENSAELLRQYELIDSGGEPGTLSVEAHVLCHVGHLVERQSDRVVVHLGKIRAGIR